MCLILAEDLYELHYAIEDDHHESLLLFSDLKRHIQISLQVVLASHLIVPICIRQYQLLHEQAQVLAFLLCCALQVAQCIKQHLPRDVEGQGGLDLADYSQ